MGLSKSLSFYERDPNSGEMDLFCSVLIYLAVLVATTLNNLLDAGVVKTLVIASFTILQVSMRYWMQT